MFVNCLFVYNFAYVYLFNFCFTVICKEKLQLHLYIPLDGGALALRDTSTFNLPAENKKRLFQNQIRHRYRILLVSR